MLRSPACPRDQRLEGGLLGLLVGDAVGVPYEFHRAESLPPLAEIELVPPVGFARAHRGTPPGTWSDDGAHALCLLASLLDRDRLDVDDLGRRLIRWYDHGYLAVDERVFDVGIQTTRAIDVLRRGVPAAEAGPSGELDNGNGSLMRVLPLALWHRGTDVELVADAETQSCVTHGHVRARVCCAVYCLWARRLLEGAAAPWDSAIATLRAHYAHHDDATEVIEWRLRPDAPADGGGTGYVVDCLKSARMVLEAGDYEAVVKAAVALGHDTDTTACVAGGLAGIRDGVESIPTRWRAALRGGVARAASASFAGAPSRRLSAPSQSRVGSARSRECRGRIVSRSFGSPRVERASWIRARRLKRLTLCAT